MERGPDPERLGGIDWLERTGGALTRRERIRLTGSILRGQAQGLAGRIALALGRRPDRIPPITGPPDSTLARDAEELCETQSPTIAGHARRTWAFGRALAAVDDTNRLDEELFYVACLLHDIGIESSVDGQDFTLRSARSAAVCADGHLDTGDVRRLQDAISVHTTPGITPHRDGAEGFYVQAGATLDLAGLRLHHLSEDYVDAVLSEHPRIGLTADILAAVRAEADAVPDGRFRLLARTGFPLAVRMAPFPVTSS